MSAALLQAETGAGPMQQELLNRHDPDVVAQARKIVRGFCALWHLPKTVAETASSCVSELVTNAVGHAVWPEDLHELALRIRLGDGTLTVEVEDPDPTKATIRRLDDVDALLAAIDALGDEEDLHGLGLGGVVEKLAELDYQPTGHGKVGRALIRLPDCSATGATP